MGGAVVLASLAESAERGGKWWKAAVYHIAASRTDELLHASGMFGVSERVVELLWRGAGCLQAMPNQSDELRTAELFVRSLWYQYTHGLHAAQEDLATNRARVMEIFATGYADPVTESGLMNLSIVLVTEAVLAAGFQTPAQAGNNLDPDLLYTSVQGFFRCYRLRLKIFSGWSADRRVIGQCASGIVMAMHAPVCKHWEDEFSVDEIWPHDSLVMLVDKYDADTTPELCKTMFYKFDWAGRLFHPSHWLVARWGDVPLARVWLEHFTSRTAEQQPWLCGIDNWAHRAAGFSDMIVTNLKLRAHGAAKSTNQAISCTTSI